jgi:hypothetical protein
MIENRGQMAGRDQMPDRASARGLAVGLRQETQLEESRQ